MEVMPYQPELGIEPVASTIPETTTATITSDWREKLPTLAGRQVTLRQLRLDDAEPLLTMLTTEEVTRFISPPPTTVEGFRRFIQWTHQEQAAGRYVCFAVVPHGMDVAVGLFQVRSLEPGFRTAEWGFILGSPFWGSGMFVDGAQQVVDFAIETIGVHRLEARAAVRNGRGNGALRKLGAVQEGVLRRSFLRHGEYLDQVLWTILADEWRAPHTVGILHPSVH